MFVEVATLDGHQRGLRGAAFSPNGKVIATCSDDRSVRLWDSSSFQPAAMLPGHPSFVLEMAFVSDSRLVAGDMEGEMRLWDTVKQAEVWCRKTGQKSFSALAASPLGTIIATGGNEGSIRLWMAASGEPLPVSQAANNEPVYEIAAHEGGVTALRYSADSSLLVSGGQDGWVKVFNARTMEQISGWRVNDKAISSIVFTKEEKALLVAGWDGRARIIDATSGEQLQMFSGHSGEIWQALMTPTGKHILTSGAEHRILVWPATGGAALGALRGHKDKVVGLALSPDGRMLVSASWDGTAKVWAAPAKRQ